MKLMENITVHLLWNISDTYLHCMPKLLYTAVLKWNKKNEKSKKVYVYEQLNSVYIYKVHLKRWPMFCTPIKYAYHKIDGMLLNAHKAVKCEIKIYVHWEARKIIPGFFLQVEVFQTLKITQSCFQAEQQQLLLLSLCLSAVILTWSHLLSRGCWLNT